MICFVSKSIKELFICLSAHVFKHYSTDFIHGTLSLYISNTYFREHFLNKITDAQRQSELFVHELLDLREQSSILTNGMTLLRSEIDSLIASVCCT